MKNFQLARFQKGQPLLAQLSAERMNAILDAIDRATPMGGDNVQVVSTPGGKIIRAKNVPQVPDLALDVSFLLKDASESDVNGNPVRKVLVQDGKVNGEFPSGMGSGDYTLTLPQPEGSLIIIGVTFDPETLDLTSIFLQVTDSASFPENEIDEDGVGHLYFLIGFTYFDEDDNFVVYQTWLGDVNFQLVYGALDGLPALFPLASIADPLPIPDDDQG